MDPELCRNCNGPDAKFSCGQCHKVKYCSQECQKSHWKQHKADCCSPADSETLMWLHGLPDAAPAAKKNELVFLGVTIEPQFLNPDNGVAAAKYRKIRLSEKACKDYYFDVEKDRMRDKLTFIQGQSRQLMMSGASNADITRSCKELADTLEKQYEMSVTVENNDSNTRLQLKVVLSDMLLGLLAQSRVTKDKKVHSQKCKAVIKSMIERGAAVKAVCDPLESVYYPSLAGTVLCDSQVESVMRLAAPFKQLPPPNKRYTGKVPPFFPGPPGWVHDPFWLEQLGKIMGSRALNFLTPTMWSQRNADESHRFYKFQYAGLDSYNLSFDLPSNAYVDAARAQTAGQGVARLPFRQHMAIHATADAAVEMLPSARCINPEEMMTANEFKRRVKVTLPHVIVGACDYCSKPTVGECLCGEVYCSKECLACDWKDHKNACNTVIDNNAILLTITPMSWQQQRIDTEQYERW